ncbi:hypothetical protein D3C78_1043150 [compost metagenome]
MNRSQVAWAKEHDWFVDASPLGSSGEWDVEVRSLEPVYEVRTGKVIGQVEMTVSFISFAKLRAWAGY